MILRDFDYWRDNVGQYDTRYDNGLSGEQLLANALVASGYNVEFTKHRKQGDLLAFDSKGNVFRVEVKTSRRNKDGRWKYCLRKRDGFGGTNIDHADFVALIQVCKLSVELLIVPSEEFAGNLTHFSVRTRFTLYRGKFGKFRQNLRGINLNNALVQYT